MGEARRRAKTFEERKAIAIKEGREKKIEIAPIFRRRRRYSAFGDCLDFFEQIQNKRQKIRFPDDIKLTNFHKRFLNYLDILEMKKNCKHMWS